MITCSESSSWPKEKFRTHQPWILEGPPHPEPTVVSDTPIKTMDGNPLGQSGDIILDDQDTPRTDYNIPSKVNDHEVESRMWVTALTHKTEERRHLQVGEILLWNA